MTRHAQFYRIVNAAHDERGAFSHLLPAERFQAWRILGDGTNQPLEIAAQTLDEAVSAAGGQCPHKSYFTVLQTRVDGKLIEHVCYVKQGKSVWVRKPGFAHSVQMKMLEPEIRFSRQMTAAEPVEPWKWTPGCDVVGIDRNEVRHD